MADIIAQFQEDQKKSLKVFFDQRSKDIDAIKKSGEDFIKSLSKDSQPDVKKGFGEVISQIKRTLSVGSNPKREDFKKASEELSKISESLANVMENPHGFPPQLVTKLQEATTVAVNAIAEKTPSLMGSGAKAAGSKAMSAVGSFASGTMMQMLSGIPMGAEIGGAIGSKVSGMFAKKDTTAQLQIAGALGGRSVSEEEAEEIAEATGGTSSSMSSMVDSVGIGGSGGDDGSGGRVLTNELLINIDDNIQWMRDNSESAESRRERLRGKDGGEVIEMKTDEKGEQKGGFFGDLFKNFKIGKLPLGQLFSKGGLVKIITALGSTLLSGVTTAFGAAGTIGKGFLAKTGPTLMKFIGPAALLAGLAMAIKDGVDGWFKSDEWGVSKISGALGGLFGGTDPAGSMKGVGKNALKWGLIGAGLGSIVPVIGTGIGFAVGALFGGILGWFGGEKISKAIQDIGDWFQEKWNGFLSIFGLDDKKQSAETRKKELQVKQDKNKMEIQQLEALDKAGKLRSGGKRRLQQLKQNQETVSAELKERESSSLGLTEAERKAELEELNMSLEETDWSTKYGIKEAEHELAKKQKGYDFAKKRHDQLLDRLRSRGRSTEFAEANFKAHWQDPLDAKKKEVADMKKRRDALIAAAPKTYTGGKIATGGLATLHPGEEVLEAAEISRIERALSGQSLNQGAMDRIGLGIGGGAGMGAGSTVIDNSVTNMSNTTITPMVTHGQVLPHENRTVRTGAFT